ncbi:MAG TPA: hypothetical protein V6C88_19705 [Chroococcidiopsis sp.]
MWHRLKNIALSLKTYGILSPDWAVRRETSRALCDRPPLQAHQWFEVHCKPYGIDPSIAHFAYSHLARYSGLPVARVMPSDRLEADLHWTSVCWFDWEISLCDDFFQEFGVDITDRLYGWTPETVGDLLRFLNQALGDR